MRKINVTEKYFSVGNFPQSRFYSSREGRDFRGAELSPQAKTTMTTINENRGNRDQSHGRSFDRGQPTTSVIFRQMK